MFFYPDAADVGVGKKAGKAEFNRSTFQPLNRFNTLFNIFDIVNYYYYTLNALSKAYKFRFKCINDKYILNNMF